MGKRVKEGDFEMLVMEECLQKSRKATYYKRHSDSNVSSFLYCISIAATIIATRKLGVIKLHPQQFRLVQVFSQISVYIKAVLYKTAGFGP